MNKGGKILLWAFGTVLVTVLATILFGPPVLIGSIIGITMTTLKHMDLGE